MEMRDFMEPGYTRPGSQLVMPNSQISMGREGKKWIRMILKLLTQVTGKGGGIFTRNSKVV